MLVFVTCTERASAEYERIFLLYSNDHALLCGLEIKLSGIYPGHGKAENASGIVFCDAFLTPIAIPFTYPY